MSNLVRASTFRRHRRSGCDVLQTTSCVKRHMRDDYAHAPEKLEKLADFMNMTPVCGRDGSEDHIRCIFELLKNSKFESYFLATDAKHLMDKVKMGSETTPIIVPIKKRRLSLLTPTKIQKKLFKKQSKKSQNLLKEVHTKDWVGNSRFHEM